MKLYRLRNPNDLSDCDPSDYDRVYGSLSEVKAAAKLLSTADRKEYVAEELEMLTDKASIVAALNDEGLEVKRTWDITPRGALKEGDAVDV